MTRDTVEQTVDEFRATQVVFPQWMEDAVRDATVVRVSRVRTFAGTFVTAVEAVR